VTLNGDLVTKRRLDMISIDKNEFGRFYVLYVFTILLPHGE
jgi:hypothetical protein